MCTNVYTVPQIDWLTWLTRGGKIDFRQQLSVCVHRLCNFLFLQTVCSNLLLLCSAQLSHNDRYQSVRQTISEIICPRVKLLYPHQALAEQRLLQLSCYPSQERERKSDARLNFERIFTDWHFVKKGVRSVRRGTVKQIHSGNLATARSWQRWFGHGKDWTLDIPDNNLSCSR